MPDTTGVFISFEGIDGVGKSTQADLMQSYLAAKGLEVTRTLEPGGSDLGVEIRHLFRNILADQPRVTRYPIDWSGNNSLAVFEPTEEEKARAISSSNDDVIDMDVEMEEDDDDDDEDEEGNENDEVDLEDEEEDEGEEDDEEGEEEEDGEVEMGAPEYEEYVTEGNFIYQDDSNSIDIDRMLQR